MNTNIDHDTHLGDEANDRIDAMARRAGDDLRRPAPAHGLRQVQRTRRKQAIARGVAGTTAAIGLALAAGLVLMRRDPATEVSPATEAPSPATAAPAPGTTGPTDPAGSTPDSTKPPVAAMPYGLYRSKDLTRSARIVIDPATGKVAGETDIPPTESAAVRSSSRNGRWNYVLSDGTESGASPFCAGRVLQVTGPSTAALPAKAVAVTLSADGSRGAVAHATCPPTADLSQLKWTVEAFDADDPTAPRVPIQEVPGTGMATLKNIAMSADGRFVAVIVNENAAYEDSLSVYDTVSGEQVFAKSEQCKVDAYPSQQGGSITPFAVDSTIAVELVCGTDLERSLYIANMADPADTLQLALPGGQPAIFTIDVDAASFVDARTAWWAVSTVGNGNDGGGARAWFAKGDADPIEVTEGEDALTFADDPNALASARSAEPTPAGTVPPAVGQSGVPSVYRGKGNSTQLSKIDPLTGASVDEVAPNPMPQNRTTSANGKYTYSPIDQYASPAGDEFDACNQAKVGVSGATTNALPSHVGKLVLSADGMVGAFAVLDDCATPTQYNPGHVWVFDPNDPSTAPRKTTVVTGQSQNFIALNEDGTLLITFTFTPDAASTPILQVLNVADGRLRDVAPTDACELNPVSFVTRTVIQFTEYCSGTGYLRIVNLADSTDTARFELPAGGRVEVDGATYTTADKAWWMVSTLSEGEEAGGPTDKVFVAQGNGSPVEVKVGEERASFQPAIPYTFTG